MKLDKILWDSITKKDTSQLPKAIRDIVIELREDGKDPTDWRVGLREKHLAACNNARIPSMRWMSDDVARSIADRDLEHFHQLIPNPNPDYDPIEPFMNQWDLHEVEDNSKLKNVKIWTPDKKLRPVTSYTFKNAMPNVGLLDRFAKPIPKYPVVVGNTKWSKLISTLLKESVWVDSGYVWLVHGVSVPIGVRGFHGQDIWDKTTQVKFSKQFTFGRDVRRNLYAIRDVTTGQFVQTKWFLPQGLSYSDKPQFSHRTFLKEFLRILYVEKLYNKMDLEDCKSKYQVVRYHFHPLFSLQYHPVHTFRKYRNAIADLNKRGMPMHLYSLEAFRFHCRKQAELRKKI